MGHFGFDTGIFLCTPAIFNALERNAKQDGDTLSGAVKLLAAEGKAKTFEISGRFWIDVDDPAGEGGHSASVSKRLIRSDIIPQTVKP
ncbi:MAG: hypothetical protein GQ565_01010 [Candidatus Aegiribacteria sp.]|nr:hypothetical protein [Candidatus Aegiribacteria sp.]